MTDTSKKELIKKSSKRLKAKAPKQHSNLSVLEVEQIKLDSKRIRLKNLELRNQELASLISMRKSYADKIMIFGILWSTITIVLILAEGFSWFDFYISSNVLVTLIASTIGNIFALATVVAKGIFSKH